MKSEMYVCRDFNINLLNNEEAEATDLIQNMKSLDLHQKINEPTRFSHLNQATLIDHLYTNSSYISKSGTLDLNISDHEIIFVINKKKKMK